MRSQVVEGVSPTVSPSRLFSNNSAAALNTIPKATGLVLLDYIRSQDLIGLGFEEQELIDLGYNL